MAFLWLINTMGAAQRPCLAPGARQGIGRKRNRSGGTQWGRWGDSRTLKAPQAIRKAVATLAFDASALGLCFARGRGASPTPHLRQRAGRGSLLNVPFALSGRSLPLRASSVIDLGGKGSGYRPGVPPPLPSSGRFRISSR